MVTGSIADKKIQNFEGIFVGQIKEGSNFIDVQTKLVRKNNKIVGAYLRQNVCGSIEGDVKDSNIEFNWEWAGNNGKGIAEQHGDTLYARVTNNKVPDKIFRLTLQRISEGAAVAEEQK